MKYVYVPVFSARSHPDQNVKTSTLEELKRYAKLDNGKCQYFISFTENLDRGKARSRSHPTGQSKIGVNPQFQYGNPIGVYAYPLSLVRNKNGSYKIPFAGDRPFIQVLKLTSNKVLDYETFTEADYNACIKKLKKLAYKNKDIVSKRILDVRISHNAIRDDFLDNVDDEAWWRTQRLCNVTYQQEYSVQKLYYVWCCSWVLAECLSNDTQYTTKWNFILRNILGYDVVLDRGFGFIHPNERRQAVFLTKTAYEHVDTIVKKTLNVKRNALAKLAQTIFRDKYIKGNVDLSKTTLTQLPDGLTVEGDLDFRNSRLTKLPRDLTVSGSVNLEYTTAFTEIPENWQIGGSLSLRESKIEALPNKLTVGKTLDLSSTGITRIPDGVSFGGNLYLDYSSVTSLPSNLHKITGHLCIKGCGDIKLPSNLTVTGQLVLRNSNITSLPDNLTVGSLMLMDCGNLSELPENFTVHSDLELPYHSDINKLGDGLTVDGNLKLAVSDITELPKRLTVGGDLDIRGTDIDTIPDDAKIGGNIFAYAKKADQIQVPNRLRPKLQVNLYP